MITALALVLLALGVLSVWSGFTGQPIKPALTSVFTGRPLEGSA